MNTTNISINQLHSEGRIRTTLLKNNVSYLMEVERYAIVYLDRSSDMKLNIQVYVCNHIWSKMVDDNAMNRHYLYKILVEGDVGYLQCFV